MRSLIDATRQKASVNSKHVAGNEAGAFRSEKNGGAHKFVELTKAFHGRAQQKFLATLCAIQQLGIEFGAKHTGSNGVHANTMAGPFNG